MLITGDSVKELRKLDENSIEAVVTDPPYGLSFMGKKWDYDVPSQEMWTEALRVLKPGGHILSFGGSRTYHRMAVAIEDAGFEIRDQIMWVYGSGFPKSLNIGKAVDKLQGNERESYEADIAYPDSDTWGVPNKNKGSKSTIWQKDGEEVGLGGKIKRTKGNSDWEGWGTALKPAHEPIVLARKPLSEKTVADNVLKWGTGGLNIDESRVPSDETITNHSRGSESAKSKGKYGNSSAQDTHQTEGQRQGRFPANLIHDGSDEVVGMFPDTKSGAMKGTYKNTIMQNKAGVRDGKEIHLQQEASSGSAARFFYCAKASKSERNRGLEGMPDKVKYTQMRSANGTGEKNFKGGFQDQVMKNVHPTVKPIALMKYLIKLVTPPKGTVLDPFMGSGSTGVAAKELGYDFIGIDNEPEYVKIAEARIANVPKTLL